MERQMDALGRIVLPAGYRKQKNLQAGDVLCVDEQEGKRMIYPRKARCALCGGKKSFFPMGDILYVKPVGMFISAYKVLPLGNTVSVRTISPSN